LQLHWLCSNQHIPLLLLMCYALTLSRHESLSGTSGPLVNRSQSADCDNRRATQLYQYQVDIEKRIYEVVGVNTLWVEPMSVFSVPQAPTNGRRPFSD